MTSSMESFAFNRAARSPEMVHPLSRRRSQVPELAGSPFRLTCFRKLTTIFESSRRLAPMGFYSSRTGGRSCRLAPCSAHGIVPESLWVVQICIFMT